MAEKDHSSQLVDTEEEGLSQQSPLPVTAKVVLRSVEQVGEGRRTDLSEIVELDNKEKIKQTTQARRLVIYGEITELDQRGFSRTEIAQKLKIDPKQVRRYLNGNPPGGGRTQRPSKLDPYKIYLKKRYFRDNFDNARALWREIQRQGYDGAYTGITLYLTQLKFEQGAIELTGNPVTKRVKPLAEGLPSVRRLSWSFFLPAKRLKPTEREQLNKLLQSEAKLAEGYGLIGPRIISLSPGAIWQGNLNVNTL